MCSRFEINIQPKVMVARYGLTVPPLRIPGPLVRPTDPALTIEPGGRAIERRFGLKADWDKRPVLNARCETLTGKPFFRHLLANRCLVPASAWYEWRKDGGHKHINQFSRPDGEPLSFAGLFDELGFVIVTCAATPEIAHVHDRMPMVLAPESEGPWLEGALSPDLLRPLPGLMAEERRENKPNLPQGKLFD